MSAAAVVGRFPRVVSHEADGFVRSLGIWAGEEGRIYYYFSFLGLGF
ncbi:MAG: hypothetical protein AVDCRST_MAG68-5702 [uncultured Gemmatimonadetes bacterium]|uniref:Uncharacterized protein n=1 Tax=uncultured Gemmatimonadota bacterium TaxID=203437 RepID=A0A6J4MVR7_9BACT|nr:MAG: hypothetical protein AVDCRST_MAG68-5702 [uncultured Gemmatimonadota bacterium]